MGDAKFRVLKYGKKQYIVTLYDVHDEICDVAFVKQNRKFF